MIETVESPKKIIHPKERKLRVTSKKIMNAMNRNNTIIMAMSPLCLGLFKRTQGGITRLLNMGIAIRSAMALESNGKLINAISASSFLSVRNAATVHTAVPKKIKIELIPRVLAILANKLIANEIRSNAAITHISDPFGYFDH